MANTLEDDLDSLYANIIHLIYKGKCVWDGCNDIQCDGSLNAINIISKKNKYFRWDLNNAILLCEAHAKWWSDNRQEPYQLLHQTHPEVGEFHLVNQSTEISTPIDLGALAAFLSENSTEAIKKGNAPFPSLHGRFDVY